MRVEFDEKGRESKLLQKKKVIVHTTIININIIIHT